MTDPERVRAVKRVAEERLLVLPGVHAVGVGPKMVGGKPTGELAIKVYLVKKKPLVDLTSDESIPAQIDGVSTDVVEMEVPRLHIDDAKERPLILGTQTQAKNALERGTLGFFAHTLDPVPKLVAVTCQHVVAPPMGSTASGLTAITPAGTPNPYKITFSGISTPGLLILVKMAGQGKKFNAFWTTTDTDSPSSIATSVIVAVNGITGLGLTAAAGPNPEDVVITQNAGADSIVGACSVYDVVVPDAKSKLLAAIAGNVLTFSGQTDGEYAIYLTWNTNGSDPTHGAFCPVDKGSALTTVASSLATAVNARAISGITATASAASVTLAGVAQMRCQITSDIRVGQPTDGFSSNCSLCCTDEIGRVLNASIELDVATIQLRRGLDYEVEVKGDSSVPVADTAIKGVHTVTDAEQAASYPVNKRGATTLFTTGVVDALDVSGFGVNTPDGITWVVFYRIYQHAMFVLGSGGAPFSGGGDSGSAVLNNSGEIVGMLFAGGSGRTVVTPIDQITTGMAVTVATASALGRKQTVTQAEGAMAMVRADGDLVTRQVLEAQAEIMATPAGKELAELVRRHSEEVQTLVNGNPRVATTWHRNGGPRIAEAVFRYLQEQSPRLPDDLDGVSLTERLTNIQRALMKYGSQALSMDLERYGPRILALTRLSYPELVARMRGVQQEAL